MSQDNPRKLGILTYGSIEESNQDIMGWHDILVTETYHPFIEHYWPHGHIIGWEHTFINEAFHILDAIVNDKEVGPYAASFEDQYKCNVVMEAIIEQAKEGKCITISY